MVIKYKLGSFNTLIIYHRNITYIAKFEYFNDSFVNDQRDAQIPFYVFIFICNSLHVSSTSCSSSGETNCVNTTSVNCRSEWQLPEIVLIQFVSPDDEHDVLETCSYK
jgi:hypothetical protein